jgi:hypothetical protein
MEIEFTLKPDDLKAMMWQQMRSRYNRVTVFFLLFGLFPAIFCLFQFGADDLIPVAFMAVMGLIPGTAWYLLGPRLAGLQVNYELKKGTIPKDLLGHLRIAIQPDAITTTTEQSATTFLWPAIERIEVTEDHAFFVTGPRRAFLLPAHAFPDKKDFLGFVETAKRYWGQGQPNGSWNGSGNDGN